MSYRWHISLLRTYLSILVALRDHNVAGQGVPEIVREAVRMKLSDKEKKSLEAIIRLRRDLARDHRELDIEDFGTGKVSWSARKRKIFTIHQTSAIPHWWGVFLFCLVRAARPSKVLELGTNLGVSACYIQLALDLNGVGELWTLEGDRGLAELAKENLSRVTSSRVEVVCGRFQDTLHPTLEEFHPIDLAFVDGHHEYAPTMQYFRTTERSLSRRGCVVLDDLYPWRKTLRRVWREIRNSSVSFAPFDTGKLGIVVKGGGISGNQ